MTDDMERELLEVADACVAQRCTIAMEDWIDAHRALLTQGKAPNVPRVRGQDETTTEPATAGTTDEGAQHD